LSEAPINICFVSQDSGLADAIARALGPSFSTRTMSDFQPARLGDLRDWCDVVLLDLREANTQGDQGNAFRLMDAICQFQAHPPMVVLCDTENRQLPLGAMDRGAYDSVANPPNIVELRLILKRASKFYAAEKEVERLRAATPGTGRLHELLGTSRVMQEMFALVQKARPVPERNCWPARSTS
jgi:DNA-binding NtrC family response regulator